MMLSEVLSGWTEVENPYEKVQNTGFVWDLWSLWRENLEEKKKDLNQQLQSGDIVNWQGIMFEEKGRKRQKQN